MLTLQVLFSKLLLFSYLAAFKEINPFHIHYHVLRGYVKGPANKKGHQHAEARSLKTNESRTVPADVAVISVRVLSICPQNETGRVEQMRYTCEEEEPEESEETEEEEFEEE